MATHHNTHMPFSCRYRFYSLVAARECGQSLARFTLNLVQHGDLGTQGVETFGEVFVPAVNRIDITQD